MSLGPPQQARPLTGESRAYKKVPSYQQEPVPSEQQQQLWQHHAESKPQPRQQLSQVVQSQRQELQLHPQQQQQQEQQQQQQADDHQAPARPVHQVTERGLGQGHGHQQQHGLDGTAQGAFPRDQHATAHAQQQHATLGQQQQDSWQQQQQEPGRWQQQQHQQQGTWQQLQQQHFIQPSMSLQQQRWQEHVRLDSGGVREQNQQQQQQEGIQQQWPQHRQLMPNHEQQQQQQQQQQDQEQQLAVATPAARRVLVDQRQKWQRITDWVSKDTTQALLSSDPSSQHHEEVASEMDEQFSLDTTLLELEVARHRVRVWGHY